MIWNAKKYKSTNAIIEKLADHLVYQSCKKDTTSTKSDLRILPYYYKNTASTIYPKQVCNLTFYFK